MLRRQFREPAFACASPLCSRIVALSSYRCRSRRTSSTTACFCIARFFAELTIISGVAGQCVWPLGSCWDTGYNETIQDVDMHTCNTGNNAFCIYQPEIPGYIIRVSVLQLWRRTCSLGTELGSRRLHAYSRFSLTVRSSNRFVSCTPTHSCQTSFFKGASIRNVICDV